ncbi:MAG: hypothetical protein WBB30_02425 [Solirubrobacterales bacterium]
MAEPGSQLRASDAHGNESDRPAAGRRFAALAAIGLEVAAALVAQRAA